MKQLPMPNSPYLSVKDAAHEIGVSKMTIYRLVNSGELRHTTMGGRTKRILREDWAAYLAARTHGGDCPTDDQPKDDS